ncbi:MAG: class I SAM-dependent methyltransferase [Parcubacteria group bacterium]
MLKFVTNIDVSFRYGGVAELIRHLRGTDLPRTVLDIGGLGDFAQVFPESKVVSVNPDPQGSLDVIAADGRSLPFADESHDVVILSDVLEHVSKKDRPRVIAEACRVTRDLVIINGPWQSPLTLEVENQIDDLNIRFFGHSNPWIAEHRRCGRPTRDDFSLPHGFCSELLLDQTPALLLYLYSVVDYVSAISGRDGSRLLATQKILSNFGPLELHGASVRKTWVARRRKSLPAEEGLVSHPKDYADRLVDLMPDIALALLEVYERLTQQRARLGFELLHGLPQVKARTACLNARGHYLQELLRHDS